MRVVTSTERLAANKKGHQKGDRKQASSRRRTAGRGVQGGRFDFEEAAVPEVGADPRRDARAGRKRRAHLKWSSTERKRRKAVHEDARRMGSWLVGLCTEVGRFGPSVYWQ